ncbi:MAG TPA: 50S ribosome-binding GTPase [Holophaga sp.]|nr:50S ribosome-binding GTPase [Holophaga sp.]
MAAPIAAPATPLFPGAVAIVRVSGDRLAEILTPLLTLPRPRLASLRTLAWGGFRERAMVLYFPAPASYSGEDVVEFHLHGNPLLVRRFLEHLEGLGIRLAQPGEFTRRALLNGKQSLLDSEMLKDVMDAATDAQLRQAQAREGGIPAWLADGKAALAPWIARAEAQVDYGDDESITLDVAELKRDLESLRARFHVEHRQAEAAQWLRNGIRIALVGRPNAGKSTLFNALAGEDRAIVTELPGTTRDVLEVRTEWAGFPLYLFDTAGLRDTEDPVERLGIARVQAVLEKADLILHLVPSMDEGPDPDILDRLNPYVWKTVVVRTFADAAPLESELQVSAARGDLGSLRDFLVDRFLGKLAPEACLGALATHRQRELLSELLIQMELLFGLDEACPPEIVASSLQGLWALLLRLTGEDRAETSLDHVFSGFCLGK